MDNVETEVEVTEVDSSDMDAAREDQQSMRDALSRNFNAKDEEKSVERVAVDETPAAVEPEAATEVQQAQPETPQPERIPLVPPADMNKWEKEAFLNPTAENAHILQQYMNRRAYETRSDYQRKMQEVEQLRQQTSGIYDVVKQYENDYAKQGISVADLTRRSIAWDRAMHNDPISTAREWLQAYGIQPEELVDGTFQSDENAQYQPQQQPQYLTREEAERIADERLQRDRAEVQQNAVAYYNEQIVQSFVAEKPLFKDPETASQLEAEMAPIVSALSSTGRYSSPKEILETAYNYVVNGNPTFSSIHQAMTAKPVIEQKQAAAQKAKAASLSISGSAGSGTPRISTKNMRDNLARRMSGD